MYYHYHHITFVLVRFPDPVRKFQSGYLTTFVPILMTTNLDAGVCSSSPCFSTEVLLVGFELEPEVGERKAMNEFFLIIMIMMKEWYNDHHNVGGKKQQRIFVDLELSIF